MKPQDTLPLLRPIEVIPQGEGEEQIFILRDPQQLSDQCLTVSKPVLFCLQYFDGQTQYATLDEAWHSATNGQHLEVEQLQQVIDELDCVFLLFNDRSRERGEDLRRDFLAASARPHRFGAVADEVKRALDDCYLRAELPLPKNIAFDSDKLALLIAPHIDYYRGAAAWAQAYQEVKRFFSGEVAVVLGTNHQYHEELICLTKKSYDTPFGEVQTDAALVEELAQALPFDAFHDELNHRDEHSIELAVTALKHLMGDSCPRVVPVLCGNLEDFIHSETDPRTNLNVRAFHEALQRITTREGKRLLVIASVDFAHLGPQFGDEQEVTDEQLSACLEQDRQMMQDIVDGQAEIFFKRLVDERNRRHVCGAAPIYHALSCTKTDRILRTSLHYWKGEDGFAAVTFGAMSLARPGGGN